MTEVATQAPAPATVGSRKTSGPESELRALFKRASKGDKSCIPEVRAVLADGASGRALSEQNGSSARWLRRSIIQKAAGENVFIQESIKQELDNVRSELEGPNPTPVDRLLAERASLCWFIVHWYENSYANSTGWTIAQAELQHRKIDKAHSRFLSAVRALAQVRKLALPIVQLNIGKNQLERGREPNLSEQQNGLTSHQLRAIDVLAGAESDGAGLAVGDPETAAEWLRGDPESVAALNRGGESFRRERLRAEVRSLASNAMATLRELRSPAPTSPSIRPAPGLPLAILEAAGTP